MKRVSEMMDTELLAACGIAQDCPDAIVSAALDAMVEHWTREGVAKIEAAAREQASWSPERKEEERLLSLRQQARSG